MEWDLEVFDLDAIVLYVILLQVYPDKHNVSIYARAPEHTSLLQMIRICIRKSL